MKCDYVLAIEHEAARLFGVPKKFLFCGDHGEEVIAAQDAVAYALWVVGVHNLNDGGLSGLSGHYNLFSATQRCARRRNKDHVYNECVSELVWYAMHGFYNGGVK